MRFTPKAENELSRLLPAGEYDIEIAHAEDQISRKGNEMIMLKVLVYDGESVGACVFDYLMESVAYKLRHCCASVGLLPKYERGELVATDLIGLTGKAKIGIKKDDSGQYPDKNIIRDYLECGNTEPKKSDLPPVPSQDDLPF